MRVMRTGLGGLTCFATPRRASCTGQTKPNRAEFQKKRPPGQPHTYWIIGVDTYRPLAPTAEFARVFS